MGREQIEFWSVMGSQYQETVVWWGEEIAETMNASGHLPCWMAAYKANREITEM